jgi:hypothetical protein
VGARRHDLADLYRRLPLTVALDRGDLLSEAVMMGGFGLVLAGLFVAACQGHPASIVGAAVIASPLLFRGWSACRWLNAGEDVLLDADGIELPGGSGRVAWRRIAKVTYASVQLSVKRRRVYLALTLDDGAPVAVGGPARDMVDRLLAVPDGALRLDLLDLGQFGQTRDFATFVAGLVAHERRRAGLLEAERSHAGFDLDDVLVEDQSLDRRHLVMTCAVVLVLGLVGVLLALALRR